MRLLTKLSIYTIVYYVSYVAGNVAAFIQPSPIHGTFIIVAKTDDGIMMASDSRCSFPYQNSEGNRFELGFVDDFKKIYVVGKNALAISGNFSIYNLLISTMVEDFKKSITTTNNGNIDIKELIPSFLKFCKQHYSSFFNNKLMVETTLFAAGVDMEKRYCIYGYTAGSNRIQEQIGTPPIVATAASTFPNDFLTYDHINVSQAGILAEKAIKDFARKNNMSDRIGGNIVIAKISVTGVEFIKNPPKETRYKYLREMVNDIFNKKINITFTSPENEKIFKKVYSNIR